MKKQFNYLIALVVAVMGGIITSCSPEDYSLGSAPVSADQLVEGIAFTVTPSADDPNTIILKSLVKGATPVWQTPMGNSQSTDFSIQLPFAGEYEVTFGVMTQAGTIWGEPYQFAVTGNNFELLSDEIWTNLAGGVDENGQGNPKKWVPCNMNYGIGSCSGPVMYMSPDDYPAPEFRNWSPNWDPGFQSWLIPADDPYMDSYITLGLDPVKGCTVDLHRVSADGAEDIQGTFALNISDAKHPLISFNGGTYSLHNAGFDGTCANYTTDIRILECTPYLLQIATMRTNSEGPWWIVWNFVSEDVKNDPSIIPTDGPELLEGAPVKEPEYTDLATQLFTIAGATASYVATQTTYLLNDEKPYDLMWWNPASAKWEWIEGYGSTWAPAYEGIEDFAMTIDNKGNCTVDRTDGSETGKFTIKGNKLVFAEPITLFEAGPHSISGTEFTVMKVSADDNEVVLGVPVEKDATGAVCKYLCANMTIKPIGGGQDGPIVIPVDNAKFANNVFMEADKYLRIQFYNPWAGKDDSSFPVDPTLLKLKKNQKFVIKFTVSGINWTATPPAAICCNMDDAVWMWEPNCYDNFQAQTFNPSGENTFVLENTTGATYSFYGAGSMQISIKLDGFGSYGDLSDVQVNVSSLTIE